MTGMVGGSGGGGGYNYVQNPEPAQPEEGEEWYDTGENKAFVYDGAEWIEQTVTSHGALSGLSSDDHPQYATDNRLDNHAADADAHHARYSDAEAYTSSFLTQSDINGATEHSDTPRLGEGETADVFNVSTPVRVLHGAILGPSLARVTVTWGDDTTTDLVTGSAAYEADTAGSEVHATFPLPRLADVKRIEFESAASSTYNFRHFARVE